MEKFRIVKNLLKNEYISLPVRWFGKHNKKYLFNDGERFESVIYYPRNSQKQDESDKKQQEPTKLFRVERIKPIKGNPFWEKRILKDLGIHTKLHDVTVVKNIPENNARLWKIKHLVKITPIMFPFGEPSLNDINHTVLKENGDCLVTKKLEIESSRIIATESFEGRSDRLDGETLRKDTRLKWLNPW